MSSKLLSEKDWNQLVKKRAHGFQIKLKMDKTSSDLRYITFVAYCESPKRIMIGENGLEVETIVCVVKGETESLVELKAREALGIIIIDPRG